MKASAGVLMVAVSTTAFAQGAPSVNEQTGDLQAGHSFSLPHARGRYQPTLALQYSSSSKSNVGYGWGWSINLPYVERMTRSSPVSDDIVLRDFLWVSVAGGKSLFVPSTRSTNGAVTSYRAEVEREYLEVFPAGSGYTAKDAGGNTYTFGRQCGARYYVTQVVDLDANITMFNYSGASCSSGSTDLTSIQFNAYGSGQFAHAVELEYESGNGGLQVEAGQIRPHPNRLARVRIAGPARGGGTLPAVVRTYRLEYLAAPQSGADMLTRVTEYGGDFALPLPPTTYDYGNSAATFWLEGGTPVEQLDGFRWADVDVDGRPDRVWKAFDTAGNSVALWARNVTPSGASALVFAAAEAVGQVGSVDYNNDGIPDVVAYSQSSDQVWLGTIDANGRVTYAEPVTADFAGVMSIYLTWWMSLPIANRGKWISKVDFNGDGIADIAFEVPGGPVYPCGGSGQPACGWHVWLGYQDSLGNWKFASHYAWHPSPYAPGLSPVQLDRDARPVDVNGDGLGDLLRTGVLSLLAGVEEAGTGLGGNVGSWMAAPVMEHPQVVPVCDGALADPSYVCPSVDDIAHDLGALVDFDGDGLPDNVVKDGPGAPLVIKWNNGSASFGREQVVPMPGRPSLGAADLWPAQRHVHIRSSDAADSGSPDYFWPYLSGDGGEFIDLNGDGVPDYYHVDYSGAQPVTWFYRGRLTDGVTGPDLDAGQAILLRGVTTSSGAVYRAAYRRSTEFGARPKSAKPVVVALSVAGRGALGAGYVSTIEENTVRYWYADAASSMAWDDPARFEDRGFGQSWVSDDVAATVRHSFLRTDFHDLLGLPTSVEVGSRTGTDSAGRPTYAAFQGTTYLYAVKSLGQAQACDSSLSDAGSRTRSLVAEEYPVRVIQARVVATALYSGSWNQGGRVTGVATTSVACDEVDQYGNVARSTVTTALGGVSAVGGPVTSTFGRYGTTDCPNVPASLVVTKSAGGAVLTSEVHVYDQKCRLVEQWAGDAAGLAKTKRVTHTYSGCYSLPDTTTSGGVKKTVTYDDYCLNPVQEEQSDADATLRTTYAYDAATGLKLSEAGPTLTAKAGYGGTLPISGIERHYVYDLLGRMVAVSKSAPTGVGTGSFIPDATSVSNAVEAHQYVDGAPGTSPPGSPPILLVGTGPHSAVSYRVAVAKSFTLGQPPSGNDTAVTYDYFDELGRKVQTRERLGCSTGACTADVLAHVTETATNYRVIGTGALDGAGRVRWTIEPFYDSGAAFKAYNWDATATPITRGTLTRFDERGRPTCKLVLPAPPHPSYGSRDAVPCSTDSAEGSSFRLATQISYTTRYEPSRGSYGGNLVAVVTVPPELNAIPGNTHKVVSLLGPLGEDIGAIDGDGNYVWVERDALNREVASWRISGDGSQATEKPAGTTSWAQTRTVALPEAASWITYNLAGQVFETWDANTGMRDTPGAKSGGVRRHVYDEAGRLTDLIVDITTGDAMEYVYGSLGRVTEVREVTYPVGGGVVWQQRRVVARNHYDSPFNAADAGYSHTPGRLSWTGTDPSGQGGPSVGTTIAYGYDDALRIVRRDQWFDALGPTRRFTVTSSYGADGRVLSAGMQNPLAPDFAYSVYYDSAGRPAEVSGLQLTGDTASRYYWKALSTDAANGAYDPLGRLPSMAADGGNVLSQRDYGPESGRLLAERKYLAPLPSPAGNLFTTSGATYLGGKLAGYHDDGTLTAFAYDYTPGGKVKTATATPDAGSGRGVLAQDYQQGFAFNGIGNISAVTESANQSAESQAAGRVATTQSTSYGYISPAAGQMTDQASTIATETWRSGRPVAAEAGGDTSYAYDFQNHLTGVARTAGPQERLVYGPTGELLYRQVDERFIFYVGPYATVTASGAAGCLAAQSCAPVQGFDVDNHVIFAATRIASVRTGVSTNRVLYYYRTRLGSVVATTTRTEVGTQVGARYRYSPYGKLEAKDNDTPDTRSELGYTDALSLTGELVYLKARVYDAGLKRFIQADSVDRLRYAYVWGDPANLHDPTGLMARNFDTWMLPPAFLSTTQAEQARMDAAGKAKDAESSGPNPNWGQVSKESVDNSEAGLTAEKGIIETVTGAAQSATEKLAAYSVDERNNSVLRAGAALLGAVTSLADKETIGTTAAVVAGGAVALLAAPAVVAALSPEVAAGGGAAAVAAGQKGESAVRRVAEIGEKIAIEVAGRTRIPDGLTSTVITEVKNRASMSYTQQLRDFAAYAKDNNLRFDLWVRPTTTLSGPLAQQAASGAINLRVIP